jgi:hypothetical protein
VLGDVGDPQLVRGGSAESSVDEIGRGGDPGRPIADPTVGQPLEPGPLHEHRDSVVTDHDALAVQELGADPVGAVDPAGVDTDLGGLGR